MIHGVWFGGKPYNELIDGCVRTWSRADENVMIWRNPYDIMRIGPSVLDGLYFQEACKRSHWAGASDVMRLAVLWEYGGIYLDHDIEVLNGEKLHRMMEHAYCLNQFVAGWEDERGVCGAVLIAPPRHPFIGRMLNVYKGLSFDQTFNGQVNGTTLLTDELRQWRESRFVDIQPTHVFYPWHWKDKRADIDRRALIKSDSVTAHHWEGSWVAK